MYEDYYSDDDEKVNTKIQLYFYVNIKQIIDGAKDKIKNYLKVIIYLFQKELNKIYKGGGPTTITLESKNLPTYHTFENLIKDRSVFPSILYLTEDQSRQYLYYYNKGKFKLTFSKKQISDTLKETKKINKKIDSLFEEIRDMKDDVDILVNREYDNFISRLMKYSSKTPMLESRKQKDFKVIKYLLQQKQKVGEYYQTLVYLNVKQIHNILKKCTQGKTEGNFELEFNPKSRVKKFPFVLFFTKRQQKYYYMWTKNKLTFEISMSNTQFHKTCFATILLNRDIHHYVKYGVLPPPPKIKRIDTPLAIEMKNLIEFDEDLIPVRKAKPDPTPPIKTKPDLIPVRKAKPDPTPSVKTQNKIYQIIEKNLSDFSKDPYKNYTPNQSLKKIRNEVLNALINEINYPLTKDILGINLTKDLKQKISKLTSEAAIGLTWIIRALVLTNRGKSPVYNYNNSYYQLSKSQIKEIIKYYFSSLAMLLNPAQKY